MNHKTDAVPTGKIAVKAQGRQDIQRNLQAVRFFRIDIQSDVVAAGQPGQFGGARQQLGHHAIVLGAAIARMQGRKLDGYAWPLVDAAALRSLADGMRSEEHTSELQSLMRSSHAVFCLNTN